VGKIIQGVLTFEPGESPTGPYAVVTPAYLLMFNLLQWENREQRLKIEALEAKLKQKGPRP